MSFGERLKEARTKIKLTQKQLADMLGVQNTAIANYESNTSSPKEEILLKIFDVLKVSPNFLFQDSFDEKNIEDKQPCVVSCSKEEKAIITKYRKLDIRGKQSINDTLDREYSYIKEKHKEEYGEDFITA